MRVTVNNQESTRAIPRIVERLAADDYEVPVIGELLEKVRNVPFRGVAFDLSDGS